MLQSSNKRPPKLGVVRHVRDQLGERAADHQIGVDAERHGGSRIDRQHASIAGERDQAFDDRTTSVVAYRLEQLIDGAHQWRYLSIGLQLHREAEVPARQKLGPFGKRAQLTGEGQGDRQTNAGAKRGEAQEPKP